MHLCFNIHHSIIIISANSPTSSVDEECVRTMLSETWSYSDSIDADIGTCIWEATNLRSPSYKTVKTKVTCLWYGTTRHGYGTIKITSYTGNINDATKICLMSIWIIVLLNIIWGKIVYKQRINQVNSRQTLASLYVWMWEYWIVMALYFLKHFYENYVIFQHNKLYNMDKFGL